MKNYINFANETYCRINKLFPIPYLSKKKLKEILSDMPVDFLTESREYPDFLFLKKLEEEELIEWKW